MLWEAKSSKFDCYVQGDFLTANFYYQHWKRASHINKPSITSLNFHISCRREVWLFEFHRKASFHFVRTLSRELAADCFQSNSFPSIPISHAVCLFRISRDTKYIKSVNFKGNLEAFQKTCRCFLGRWTLYEQTQYRHFWAVWYTGFLLVLRTKVLLYWGWQKPNQKMRMELSKGRPPAKNRKRLHLLSAKFRL